MLYIAFVIYLLFPISGDIFQKNSSRVFYSNEGNRLNSDLSKDGNYQEWVNISEMPEHLIETVIANEDKRFYYHAGIDPIAIIRSIYFNIKSNHIVSGASTITQQVARTTYSEFLPANPYIRKILELFLAIKLELWFKKSTILEAYINTAPIKNNWIGFPSASRKIFNKNIKFITKDESIGLTLLLRKNKTNQKEFTKRYNLLKISSDPNNNNDLKYLIEKIFPENLHSSEPFLPETKHYESWVNYKFPNITGKIKTTLSSELNHKITKIIRKELGILEKDAASNASVIVLKLPEKDGSIELKAMVGSRDFEEAETGQVNGSSANRNAGSTLKPFIYALGFDLNAFTPATIFKDEEFSISVSSGEGVYSPKNTDLSYWGDLTVAESLANSRNIPAVKALLAIGVNEFYNFLKDVGFSGMKMKVEHYGPSLALGAGGTTLLELCHAYSIFPNKGFLLPLRIGYNNDKELILGNKNKFIKEETAEQIISILMDKNIRRRSFGERNFLDFPYSVAAKTGTSKDYKDSWAIGFTDKYVVGAWVGNFSGKKMNKISGVWGAGRIFHQVIRLVTDNDSTEFKVNTKLEKQNICRKTGKIAGDKCSKLELYLTNAQIPKEICDRNHNTTLAVNYNQKKFPKILFPVLSQVFLLDPNIPLTKQSIPIKVDIPNIAQSKKYFLQIDNSNITELKSNYRTAKTFDRGEHTIRIMESEKELDKVKFIVK
jgi:penicillin-binding protein 1C